MASGIKSHQAQQGQIEYSDASMMCLLMEKPVSVKCIIVSSEATWKTMALHFFNDFNVGLGKVRLKVKGKGTALYFYLTLYPPPENSLPLPFSEVITFTLPFSRRRHLYLTF